MVVLVLVFLVVVDRAAVLWVLGWDGYGIVAGLTNLSMTLDRIDRKARFSVLSNCRSETKRAVSNTKTDITVRIEG